MNKASVGRLLLQARLGLARHGGLALLAVALCVAGGAGWLWFIPHQRAVVAALQAAIDSQKQALLKTPATPQAPPLSEAQSNLLAFYAALGTRPAAMEQVRSLFDLAREAGIVLEKGEYKSAYSLASRSHGYQVLLPVSGSYSAIRRFCEKVLLAIPFSTLDEISFWREGIAAGPLQARLRFTLHLGDAPTPRTAPELLTMRQATP